MSQQSKAGFSNRGINIAYFPIFGKVSIEEPKKREKIVKLSKIWLQIAEIA